MTTETKAPTVQQVTWDAEALRLDLDTTPHTPEYREAMKERIARLRDLALLGVQVPALRAQVAEQQQTIHLVVGQRDRLATDFSLLQSAEAALQARVAELEGLLHVAGQHRDAAIDREDVLRARVAESERKRETMQGELQTMQGIVTAAVEQRESAESERDALRAQVDVARRMASEAAEAGTFAWGRILLDAMDKTALSAPPAEAKTAEPEDEWCCQDTDCTCHQ